MNILGKRYLFFAISALLIIPGFIIMAVWGMPLSIDFKGGTLIDVSFASGTPPANADVYSMLKELGIDDVQVQSSGTKGLSIRFSIADPAVQEKVLGNGDSAFLVQQLESRFNEKVTVNSFTTVGPTIGSEVASRAALAVAVAAFVVILYITWAFRGIPHASRYGICAIIAMIHDIAVVVSISAIGGHFFGWQIDSLFLTALLTVIGFSVQDKVVVFDRIRENSNILRRLDFEKLVNHSIVQTLQRSINTQLMTVEFMLMAIVLFGGVTLREFALILLIGLFMGTYSSIFIAAPILVIWEKKEWKTWFGRKDADVTVG